ncbi:MAG TPA: class I SAM-dependent methyltransferase [Candidatus Thermoplasmatota archaeon]|nr:class I SAM-dependent methyltransferase [Candidatus Thermoplasmatota archaeon]
MKFPWPAAFPRIPTGEWVQASLDTLAVKYDKVEHHGWYANLDPTVDDLQVFLHTGDIAIDYSGGTGIFIDRLLKRIPGLAFGVVNVDASPKFLRLSFEKFRGEERVAFRWLRFLKDEKRLEFLDEVLGPAMVQRGVEAIVSTNAIHLYYDLPSTLASWNRVLKTGGRVFIQSGNIRPPLSFKGKWIIDDTVDALARAAAQIVREDSRWSAYRTVLDDPYAMAAHTVYRRRVFLPPRPLDYYAEALWDAGFELVGVRTVPIEAIVDEWFEFLAVYHDAILGWVGGAEKVEGKPPSEQALQDRMALMRVAMERVFGGRGSFEATWTYMTCAKRPAKA